MKNLLVPKAKNGMLFFLIISCLTFSKCTKDDPLPEFYFQCKVDGVLYEPDNCANCETKEMYGDSLFSLGANSGNEALGLAILKHSISIGAYSLGKAIIENKGTALYDNTIGNPSDIFRTDSIRTGVVNITELDRTNKIIVGTFSFDAYNIPKNKIVKVTEGKFRLNYRSY